MPEEPTAIQKAEEIEKDVKSFVALGEDLVVTNEEQEKYATEFLGQCKDRWKKIEAYRKDFTAPLNETVGKLNKLFKAQQDPLDEVEKKIKLHLVQFHTEQTKKAEEAQKKAEEEAKKNKGTDPVPIMVGAEKTKVKTASATASYTKVWDFTVEDIKKIPAEYMMVDEVKIRAEVKGGLRELKGTKIFSKTILAVR